jgi:hypothetical protein
MEKRRKERLELGVWGLKFGIEKGESFLFENIIAGF